MTVVVTGANGFLGAWTTRALVAQREDVIVVVRPSSDPWRLSGVEGFDVVSAQTSDWPSVIAEARPDAVIALDWAGVANTHRDAPEQYHNVERMLAMAQAAASVGVGSFVGVGSQAEFGPRVGKIGEEDPPAPVTEYGRAKALALTRLREVLEPSDTAWTWARVFSTYGPMDNPCWLLPLVAAALNAGVPIDLTPGTQVWSYLHGADAGRAFAMLATSGRGHGTVNLGSPDPLPLREMITTFAEPWGRPDLLHFGGRPFDANQVMHLEPTTDKLSSLGWSPRVPMNNGLAETAAWWRGEDCPDATDPTRFLPRPRAEAKRRG